MTNLEHLREHTYKHFPQHPQKFVNEVLQMYAEDPKEFDEAMNVFKAEVLDKFTVDADGYINLDTLKIIKSGTQEYRAIVDKIEADVAARTAPPEAPATDSQEHRQDARHQQLG